jgi:hypothetical protein
MSASTPTYYGLLAEFENPQQLMTACEKARDAGYKRMDAYTPYPVEGLTDALGHSVWLLPYLVLCGGILGGCGGFFLQYYTAVIDYPYNIGGRPLLSWPMFIPVTFECTILGSALTAVFGMLALNGLPSPYHPLFHIERFTKASQDGFFLAIRTLDAKFDAQATRELLLAAGAREVTEVPL